MRCGLLLLAGNGGGGGAHGAAAESPGGGGGTAAPSGAAARGPGREGYAGICLGNCFECHSLLEALPRWPRLSAASSHVDPSRSSVEELEAFLSAPEVCDIRELYPVSVDGEIWSLAALAGGPQQLRFPGARSQVRAVAEMCTATIALAADAFAEARRSAVACAAGSPGDGGARCRGEASRRASVGFLRRWHSSFGPALLPSAASSPQRPSGGGGGGGGEEADFVVEVRFGEGRGNETGDLLQAFATRVGSTLLGVEQAAARAKGSSLASAREASLVAGRLVQLPLGETASAALLGASVELAKAARLLVEHARTVWGLRDLLVELSSVYPQIRGQMPTFRFHPALYGRHWDVLEWLMHSLVAGPGRRVSEEEARSESPLRMVELGVACGPIGFHLLPRFPSLRYFGADPTIPPEVWEAYSLYADRATLYAKTSEDLHDILKGSEPLDLVFIDGPHTYKNVRNDLEMWAPRMRPGGIIAGHDFTCAHPPLLWAVTEFRINEGGGPINLAMDGVWWWRAE